MNSIHSYTRGDHIEIARRSVCDQHVGIQDG